MKSREEAVKLIILQMKEESPNSHPMKGCWHYGFTDLRELLDFIYEGEPKTEEEKLKREG